MCAEWRNDPEAGDYVELTAGGGIVEFDLDRDDGKLFSCLLASCNLNL